VSPPGVLMMRVRLEVVLYLHRLSTLIDRDGSLEICRTHGLRRRYATLVGAIAAVYREDCRGDQSSFFQHGLLGWRKWGSWIFDVFGDLCGRENLAPPQAGQLRVAGFQPHRLWLEQFSCLRIRISVFLQMEAKLWDQTKQSGTKPELLLFAIQGSFFTVLFTRHR
jgi:hypothetical protein